MATLLVKGVIPPLTTPFTEAGEVYEDGLRRLLEFQIEKGVHAVFVCGSYGLGPLMSLAQRKHVVEVAAGQIKRRIAVIAHVGTTNTADSVELARHAESKGVDAVAAVPPFYYTHDEKTVVEHYRELVKAVGIPVYAYNNPKTTNFTITPPTVAKLADLGVKGMKDSGFNLVAFSHFVNALASRDFNLIIGSEALLLPAMLLGANGCVSALSNVFPEVVVELYNTIARKDYEEAAKLHLRAVEARRILHLANSTTAACYALLNERGVGVGVPKRPVLPTTEDEVKKMKKEFNRLGLLKT
ncbi:MAG: dihydrodipicolinate synthase family protein [Candidatus Bathyarchaeota archaeon]|nr:dihydrodipicolinate synthase family protein [Candidatus Bathyarchaeota archaeon]